jgi:transcriptional antiterminator
VSKASGRIVIYPKDVQRLTGKSEKSSRELFKKIRLCKAKEKHQFVSIEDFAEFTGISVDLIKQHLTD